MPTRSLDVLARLDRRVPAALAARADTSAGEPVAPRPSASVVLLREAADGGLETYLLHRHARMPFAPSVVVFPGGGVDPADAGPDPRLACALRETAEETGVALVPGALRRWAHWVTPAVEPRRYDTLFYVAALPAGAEASDVSGETTRAGWDRPAAALAAADRGELVLMPPTRSVLLELADLPDLAAVAEAARDRVVETVLPVLRRDGAGWVFVYPDPAGSRS
ncbi:NUDIX domain-containing protein [Microlunatus capsulatus]|uniref:8-oxo-dGTP pyrophosphatase MutT (NUDIX family) n=1 Tax=Microlunatus capsulatus TaxID=99117 RepID=A0ABS4Z9Y9_9ACTN|nr:NUDIX domain-containing protein [Microlunatus capsulatus]MBP2417575.1 8-oxo-dGTP pyrophosphatase MutT (NUDIX family) [Microlunatus capsulatus]